ncbi:hypothetical protein BDZ97DRAFT_1755710 [Flammula alnicola]|nr:hypothetical protein BDZ97DRAFT_1755710 [Flammula alnicola]
MLYSHHAHHTTDAKSRKSNALNIRLTESAVFLPTDSAPPRRDATLPDVRNATLRGLLILDLVKPTKITSIEVELTAMTSTAWPEGIGARRIDITEDHRVFHASTVYFNGSKTPSRRTASIGPGVSYSRFNGYTDAAGDLGDDFDGPDWDEMRSHLPRADHHVLDAALSRSRSRGINRSTSNANPHVPAQETLPSEAQAGPSNFAQSQLVYPNEPSTPISIHREDTSSSSSTAHSHNSFPYLDSQTLALRRASLDISQLQRIPLYETNDEGLENLTRTELEQLAPIPPYSPFPVSPISPQSLTVPTTPARPAQSLEEFRNSLHLVIRNSQDQIIPENRELEESPSRTQFSAPTLSQAPTLSPGQRSSSSSSSPTHDDHLRSHSLPRSTRPTLPIPLEAQASSSSEHQSPLPQDSPSPGHERERGRKRFSFSTIFMRSNSPKISIIAPTRERTRESERNRGRSADVSRRTSESDARRRGRTMERGFGSLSAMPDTGQEGEKVTDSSEKGRGVIGRILKERDKEKENSEGWKEFKPGTYTYPISFSIPSDAPPTMQCDFGSVVWQLKANVHRPGTFKPKMTATRDVIVIACPTEEDTEDTENILVERQWEQQLQYLIAVSGRSFYIGGTMPVTFTLMPLAKVKIHRLSVYIEERIDYYTNMRRIARTDPITRFCLLAVKGEGKPADPILPLDSDSPDALRNSPLFSIIDPNLTDAELSETASNLMERGDDEHLDGKTGKRKLFDIVVQTPVLILSCRCNPEWTSLPRYAEAFDDSTDIVPSCPCQVARNRAAAEHPLGFRPSSVTAALERITSRQSTDSSSVSTGETSPINPRSMRSLRQASYNESILRSSSLFERLVSGQESETGEAPPAYDGIPRPPATVVPMLAPTHGTGVAVI